MRYMGAVRGVGRFASEDIVYRDVLFLCLNTEDAGYGRISEAQQAYMADALAANPDEPRLYRHRGHRYISTR